MASIFTQIYQGELPGFVLAESDSAFAILNRYPNQHGHILVMPKTEVPHLFDLPLAGYSQVMEFVYRVARTLQKTTQATKIGVAVEGFGVKDHAHIHLMPLHELGDLDISMAEEATDEELARFAQEFAQHWTA